MAQAIRSDALYLPMQAQMIQAHFVPLFAQDPPPSPPAVDIPIIPQVIAVVDLEEDGVIPMLVEEENGFELHDLIEPEDFPVAVPVVPLEPIVEIADLEDVPPLVSDDDGCYDTKPRHIRRFRSWPPRV